MSPRGRYRGRSSGVPVKTGLGPTWMKLGLYSLTLAMLIAFWTRLSDGAAGCYTQISDQGQQGLLPSEATTPAEPPDNRAPGLVPVGTKLSPSVPEAPKD